MRNRIRFIPQCESDSGSPVSVGNFSESCLNDSRTTMLQDENSRKCKTTRPTFFCLLYIHDPGRRM